MRTLALVAISLLALSLVPAAEAGPNWLPVCKDKDVRTGVVNVHVGLDCYPGVWVDVCPPGGKCQRIDVALE